MKESGPLMVIIYADWCGHCQASESAWTELANKIDGKATVYAIEESEYTGGDVQGYPTMKLVKNGKVSNYEGDRSPSAMENALLGGGKRSRRSRTRRLGGRRRKTHRAFR
jgi:thiol-disulfide isomerase/thioredoxin